MTETGRIFYQEIMWNGAPALNYGVRFNQQAVPSDGVVCIVFKQDGTWEGQFKYTPEGFQLMIEGAPCDYNALETLRAKVRAQTMKKVWL